MASEVDSILKYKLRQDDLEEYLQTIAFKREFDRGETVKVEERGISYLLIIPTMLTDAQRMHINTEIRSDPEDDY